MTNRNYLPKVKEQYEEFPYPHRDPANEMLDFLVPYMARLDAINHHCFDGKQDFKNFRILIAGGGTGDSLVAWAEQLRDIEGTSVVYLDMSVASMCVAKERANLRGLKNIEWINDSLLNVPNLGLGPFDFVECSGVLHHLEDPDAGLKALTSVLKPDGAMVIMVYATYGRTGVYLLQNLMREINGDKTASEKIGNTREVLKALPKSHWFHLSRQMSFAFDDVDSDAGLYDLLLHSQDKPFTIAQVHDWLERCGMKMAGEPGVCYAQLQYLPETFIEKGPLLDEIKKLPLKRQQAIAEGLSGKIIKHEFYAVKRNALDPGASINDTSLIPWAGIFSPVSLQQLIDEAKNRNDGFFVMIKNNPLTSVRVPAGKFMYPLLCAIDGQRTTQKIVDSIPGDKNDVLKEFKELFLSLNRSHALFLRHPHVTPFMSATDIQNRLTTTIYV